MSENPGDKWIDGPDGPIMPDKQREFMEWLIDPERRGTQKQMSEKLGVSTERLRVWKHDPRFKAELDKRLAELNIDAYRVQQVVDAMWLAATQERDTKAAGLYLQYVGKFMPTQRIEVSKSIESLSDEELAAEVRQLIAAEEDDPGFLRVVGE